MLRQQIKIMCIDDIIKGEEAAASVLSSCALCGIAEVDDVKLKQCDDCDLVRYCGDNCQQHHRPEHEAKCKERAAELRDEILFKQPESTHLGDCPICCLPLLKGVRKNAIYPCCSKRVCKMAVFSLMIYTKREKIWSFHHAHSVDILHQNQGKRPSRF